ncbi:flap endonuclease GEN homolog 1 [Osmerus eperlanus]|uniref:flap endonuclease GEN homolog 1 n=1 Tax=Osmerus eperlanus TaxID=29151 RepID=UPI002E0E792D
MGVHDLWSILGPVCESVPLYSLAGKTLAVDLSLWVCEAQHVQGMMGKVTKPHLRNLFFRVSSLTLMGVKLVFVMEGEAPKLKAETMRKRTDMRFGGFKKAIPKTTTTKTTTTKGTTRGRFNAVLRECAEMLDCLGVPWVTAAGEAEAMCAYLDSQGLVDGCITNDGDAFLYGAQTVYRNFNMNTKDPQVDCYKMPRVQLELHLERETLVGLAILLGCDYIPKGIPGVGKELALKLIKTCKGQTLLQKFHQWREEGVGVSGEGRKKRPHCLVCRHPGSAKAHERAGCVLCDSKHFCEPKDYDYQCPCDWHRYEPTYQTSSVEASIRKKTLASDQFPFTEIVNEFLIDKDKPVHHFKRRKPNMLLMQNFAHDQMEWPKHYTSAKVLVLMTYSELMNRRHGRETSPQIQPLQIWKPRVRNAVACFEVIWRKPDHYVFPEEHAAASREEVRTVEEEALFRVAYPEVVELYLAEKALAENKKTKKNKPKSKKEEPADACDGVSDLLSQMSLHGSTTERNPQQPNREPNPSTASHLRPERVPLLSSEQCVSPEDEAPPESSTKLLRTKVVSPPSLTSSWKGPEMATSPSISTVMDALHLSDIDWEAMSFTSSPTQPVTSTHIAGPKPVRTSQDNVEQRERKTTQASSSDLRPAESTSSEPCESDFSLRDRVLKRNTFQSVKIIEPHHDHVTKHVNTVSKPINPLYSHNQGTKSTVLIPNKDLIDRKPVGKPPNSNKLAPLVDKDQNGKYELNSVSSNQKLSKSTHRSSAQQVQRSKDDGSGKCKPQHRYTFVKAAISSSSVPPLRSHSEPGEGDKNSKPHHATKKSVCTSVCSSSEDSDVENRQPETQRRATDKPRCLNLTDYPLKPVSVPSITKVASETIPASVVGQVRRSCVPSEVKYQLVPLKPSTIVDDDVFIQIPSSPGTISDDDDSVVCAESPLPLAERLRLKFLK